MRRSQAIVAASVLSVVGVALIVAAVLAGTGGSDAAPDKGAPPPRAQADRFDERRAFALLRAQVEEYGPRPAGSPASRRLAERLRALLPDGRFEKVPGGLRNVVGTVPGRRPAIVIGAHYDTEAEPEDHVGANDGAAGTAAVVELARVLARTRRPADAPELRFVLFDGEEEPRGGDFFREGRRGSRAYARRHRGEIRAAVILDYIADRRLSFPREAGSDEALWRSLRRAARRVGVGASFPDGTRGEIIDDHTSFTEIGVPAIDLIDFDYPVRDTAQDDVSQVSARSLNVAGEAVLELIRTWPRR